MVMKKDKIKEIIYINLLRISGFISLAILIFIISFIILKGIGVINLTFLTSIWTHNDITQGGIIQAIIGTIMLGIGVSIISIPLGVCTAIYLHEYASNNILTKSIKLSIRNLAGIPSVIYGLFGLAFFVLFLKLGGSVLSASLTLGCMTLPWIITSTEEALKAVPDSFREGSYALGATKWQTIKKNVLPNASGGIITGSILGVSRSLGETAPIIIVGATFFISYLSYSPLDKFMALPYHIFILATQHSSPYAQQYALGTALVLISVIFIMNLSAFIIRYKIRGKKEW
ncbi:MAG: phosphate ABC transporter permease PstA [Nanoarchaeota archaeon]